MSKVKRFDFDTTGCQVEDPLGGYVDHDDYAKLEAEAQVLREEVAALRAMPDRCEDTDWLGNRYEWGCGWNACLDELACLRRLHEK